MSTNPHSYFFQNYGIILLHANFTALIRSDLQPEVVTLYGLIIMVQYQENTEKSRYGGSLVWQITHRHGSTNGWCISDYHMPLRWLSSFNALLQFWPSGPRQVHAMYNCIHAGVFYTHVKCIQNTTCNVINGVRVTSPPVDRSRSGAPIPPPPPQNRLARDPAPV